MTIKERIMYVWKYGISKCTPELTLGVILTVINWDNAKFGLCLGAVLIYVGYYLWYKVPQLVQAEKDADIKKELEKIQLQIDGFEQSRRKR